MSTKEPCQLRVGRVPSYCTTYKLCLLTVVLVLGSSGKQFGWEREGYKFSSMQHQKEEKVYLLKFYVQIIVLSNVLED